MTNEEAIKLVDDRMCYEKGWIITPSLERAGISFVDWWMPLPEFKKGGWKND